MYISRIEESETSKLLIHCSSNTTIPTVAPHSMLCKILLPFPSTNRSKACAVLGNGASTFLSTSLQI